VTPLVPNRVDSLPGKHHLLSKPACRTRSNFPYRPRALIFLHNFELAEACTLAHDL